MNGVVIAKAIYALFSLKCIDKKSLQLFTLQAFL
jgi:hypothetical protein